MGFQPIPVSNSQTFYFLICKTGAQGACWEDTRKWSKELLSLRLLGDLMAAAMGAGGGALPWDRIHSLLDFR